ncbi:hypothetical protein CTAYLR_007179 [Chrysophaeum taylorii]|uniref:Uncharacterized protein n=1 Tax=Chrysophaeum taylorii TaxID=2483200 RepID=A0AAD7UMB6_9STRA|nr:hypothetical protein CTAYLR_007179 [Chrysophaeum taylorii]
MLLLSLFVCASVTSALGPIELYAKQLRSSPVLTKSATSATVFALSDACAQTLEGSWSLQRFAMTSAIGGCYFGPAAHFWYEALSRLVPRNSLPWVAFKAILGQIFFGPLVTCAFFASACIQTQSSFPAKVKADLLDVQLTGLAYWPFVDMLCLSLIPVPYIPVAINLASFLWTIFLSLRSR